MDEPRQQGPPGHGAAHVRGLIAKPTHQAQCGLDGAVEAETNLDRVFAQIVPTHVEPPKEGPELRAAVEEPGKFLDDQRTVCGERVPLETAITFFSKAAKDLPVGEDLHGLASERPRYRGQQPLLLALSLGMEQGPPLLGPIGLKGYMAPVLSLLFRSVEREEIRRVRDAVRRRLGRSGS